MDLIQEGNIGLMIAVDRFDVSKGNHLSTYATYWIEQTIKRGIKQTSRIIRVPVYIYERNIKLAKIKNQLQEELKREPTIEELATEMNISPKKIDQLLKSTQDILSLDYPNEEDQNLLNALSNNSSLEEEVLNKIEQEETRKLLLTSNLNDREKGILFFRNGFDGNEPKTCEEVGKLYGVSRQCIEQCEKRVIKKLKKKIKYQQSMPKIRNYQRN